MRTRTWLGAVGLAATAVTGAAPFALAAPAVAAVNPDVAAPQVLPLSGIAGSPLTIRGAGCLFNGQPGMAKAVIGDGVIPTTPTPAGPDGTWTVNTRVPADTPPGRYPVRAACGNAQGGFDYPEAVYFVSAPGVTPEVKVSATMVTPGDTLTVSGTDCLVDGRPGRLEVGDLFHGPAQPGRHEARVGRNGAWRTTLTVPADSVKGSVPIGAHCLGADGSIQVFYVPAIVTVGDKSGPGTPPGTAPGHKGKPKGGTAAEPVVVTPKFAG